MPKAVIECSLSQLEAAGGLGQAEVDHLGHRAPSWLSTRMFEGLRSRWMIPFWWACCTAEQIWRKASAVPEPEPFSVAILGERDALDQLHDEKRPPSSVEPASSTLAMFG